MTINEQKAAARTFAEQWAGRGDEKQETQTFWLTLLQKVFGVEDPAEHIQFELPVKIDHTSFIDAYLPGTRVLVEQKGCEVDPRKGYRQSDGSLLTPFQQARRYAGYLPHNQNPRWIVVCNFREFHIHDMNRPNDAPEVLLLSELEQQFHRLQFLVDTGSEHIKREMEVSIKAGELVGLLYDEILQQYKDPANPESLKSLNMLCVRLVFCLYAEDAGIFGRRSMFHDYLQTVADHDIKGVRRALIDLFRVLDTLPRDRDPYLEEDLAAFPYVNGGLFADENIEIPQFTPHIVELLLHKASEDFDWSEISPTIFGAVFESTLNPETRRKGGMHYTSIENIHKVIDPLFLDDLKAELAQIRDIRVDRTRNARLTAFQKKLAGLTFLDPACGSGNFLTETYLSLRRLENEVIDLLQYSQLTMGGSNSPVQVSIRQFYGIEINDFAVTVAKTALWIAESQMLEETKKIVYADIDFLPLKTNAYIVEGNALTLDWQTVVPKDKLDYIMGNPPFVGKKEQSKIQKNELLSVFNNNENGVGNLDYVCGWYMKASQFIQGSLIHAAFVSTNSITQGEQVSILWAPLLRQHKIHIDFAYRTFKWDSEAKEKAAVHCVIIGFSSTTSNKDKVIYLNNQVKVVAQNISPYLIDSPNILIQSRNFPLCSVPEIVTGNQATDGGHFYISKENYTEFVTQSPNAVKYIRKAYNSQGFINGNYQYCLWLYGASPAEIKGMPNVLDRIEKVRQFRLSSTKAATRKLADIPTLFTEIRQPKGNYIVIPKVSSENRRYIPLGFLTSDVICNNTIKFVPNATLYHFGVLCSNVHNSWMRTVAGRLKSDYQYSNNIVYNNFIWPTPTEAQKARIEQTAQAILDARALYPDSSLADLYDETTMPPELRKAHQANDRAVMAAYGFDVKTMTEASCVAELMKLYQQKTAALDG
ncbi:DNA methyltransferase [uncultured Subdoligranulum sp.]|uniref:DNA methyltransferase n=1 Tax=uncultured Subdoligranulum sp. TaxID=512298 RepID=UPI002611AEDF|nr:DNA methyltransferase [uncultured Subdoligranulum sp.]